MKKFLFIVLLLTYSLACADGLTSEDIDVNRISNLLPLNWKVRKIKDVDTPIGWTKISGQNGIQITLSRAPYSTEPVKAKSGNLEIYHPEFIFCIMPSDFSGKSGNGAIIKKGILDIAENIPARAMLILKNFRNLGDFYVFFNKISFEDWKNPEEIFTKVLNENKNL